MKSLISNFYFYFLLTVLIGGSPFFFYLWEKQSGQLTTPDQWYANGSNHGPWRYESEGLLMYTPIFFIFILTLFWTLMSPEKNTVYKGGALLFAQTLIIAGQFWFMGWTVG